MDGITRVALISDLFFNYQNEAYSKLDWEKVTDEQIDVALSKDAIDFSKQYFELLTEAPGLPWKTEDEFALWLVKNFQGRT
jgi:hypothetical protein